MKMYDRQRGMKSFVGLREKTSSEVIYVASPTQAVVTESNDTRRAKVRGDDTRRGQRSTHGQTLTGSKSRTLMNL